LRILGTITNNDSGGLTSMNLNLRQAILQKIQDKSNTELTEIITGSIGGEEQVLPGLGVLFEIIWEHSEKSTQQQLVKTLENQVTSK
jgi:small acid-soluble spore protein I (minor)